jgi:hypothetical protein
MVSIHCLSHGLSDLVPFQGTPFNMDNPGLKPRAESFCPFGAILTCLLDPFTWYLLL